MDKNQAHYAADRLLRAHVRGEEMNQHQRQDLHDDILSQGPPEDIAAAAKAMLEGGLTDDAVKALYKAHKVEGFKVEEHRASLAPAPSASAVRDARLAALLNG